MNENALIVIISATITSCQMKNIPENAYECKTLMNRNGFGNFVEGDMDIRICYVVKPSTCPDLIDSVYYDDEQYSEKACHMRAIHETKDNAPTVPGSIGIKVEFDDPNVKDAVVEDAKQLKVHFMIDLQEEDSYLTYEH